MLFSVSNHGLKFKYMRHAAVRAESNPIPVTIFSPERRAKQEEYARPFSLKWIEEKNQTD